MRPKSEIKVYVDPPGEGPATKVNKGARIGDVRIAEGFSKWTRTEYRKG